MVADAMYRGGDKKGYNYLRLTATLSKSW